MGTKSRVRSGMLYGVAALAVLISAQVGWTDVTTERPGSILILPKVVYQPGVRDTVIEISNTTNSLIHAKCWYVNGAPLDPTQLPDPVTNPPLWQANDFTIWLTRQQPTHFVASRGRQVDPTDALGTDGAGFDPGSVPPVIPGFTGELICVQVDGSGVPVPGNALKGEAKLLGPGSTVSEYNAIAVVGNQPTGDPDVLSLNNTDYGACPAALAFTHVAEGAPDLVFGQPTSSSFTAVPCSQDFANNLPSTVSVSVESYDELEVLRSTTFSVPCFLSSSLDDIGGATNAFGSDGVFGPIKQTIMRPRPVCSSGPFAGQACSPAPDPTSICPAVCDGEVGLLGVVETSYSDGVTTSEAASNVHAFGELPGATITFLGE